MTACEQANVYAYNSVPSGHDVAVPTDLSQGQRPRTVDTALTGMLVAYLPQGIVSMEQHILDPLQRDTNSTLS